MSDTQTARAQLDETIAYGREHSGGKIGQLYELFDILVRDEGTKHLAGSPRFRLEVQELFMGNKPEDLAEFLERAFEKWDDPNCDI